jgi:hypothetical protein
MSNMRSRKKLKTGESETRIEFSLLSFRFVSVSRSRERAGTIHALLFDFLAQLTKIIPVMPNLVNLLLVRFTGKK